MKKYKISCKSVISYTFDDMIINVLIDSEQATYYVCDTEETHMEFVFSVPVEELHEIKVESLHDCGYFDNTNNGCPFCEGKETE